MSHIIIFKIEEPNGSFPFHHLKISGLVMDCFVLLPILHIKPSYLRIKGIKEPNMHFGSRSHENIEDICPKYELNNIRT